MTQTSHLEAEPTSPADTSVGGGAAPADVRAGLDRRALLRCGGVVGVGACTLALAACGGSDGSADAGATTGTSATASAGSSTSSTPAAAGGVPKSEIPVGGGKVFADAGYVITQPTAGEFKAFTAVCTHQKLKVGAVADGTINCFNHGSKFDIATGEVKNGPATEPLPAKTVTADGDMLTVA